MRFVITHEEDEPLPDLIFSIDGFTYVSGRFRRVQSSREHRSLKLPARSIPRVQKRVSLTCALKDAETSCYFKIYLHLLVTLLDLSTLTHSTVG